MEFFKDFTIITVGDFVLTMYGVIGILVLFIGSWVFLRIVRTIISHGTRFSEGQKFTVYTLIKYFLYVFLISASLRFLGIDISVLLAGSAALFVGIGLGLQGLFYDFISGIILLIEGTIRVGNVIQIGDRRVVMVAIRFRTSVVKTRDEKEIIIPNSYLTKNEVTNWSYHRNLNRHSIDVSVSERDVDKAMELMKQAAESHRKVCSDPAAYVRIENFGDYAISLRVLFWSEEVLTVGRMLGEVRLSILQAFRANNIVLPFPQQILTVRQVQDSPQQPSS